MRRRGRRAGALSLAIAAALLWCGRAGAGDATWTGATSSDWATATNWSPNTVPGAANTATFSTGATLTSVLTATLGSVGNGTTGGTDGVNLIQFGTGGGDAQAYTFNNSVFFASGGGITVNAGVTQPQAFTTFIRSSALTRNNNTGTLNITNNGSAPLSLNGGEIAGVGSPATGITININFAGSGDVFVGAGGIGERLGTGANTKTNVIKSGTGTLTITGGGDVTGSSTTFAGTTTINQGAVNVQNAGALGRHTSLAADGTTVSAGAALQVQGNVAVPEFLSLAGTGVNNDGALRNLSDSNSFTAPIVLAGATRINADAGTLTLSSATAINASGTPLGLTFGGAGNVAVSSGVANVSALTKDGAGTLTLSAATPNTYTGTTSISGGTLLLNATHGSGASPVDNYTITGGVNGPATLGGGGTVFLAAGKTVTAAGAANNGIVAPGGAGAVGTLTLSAGDPAAGLVIGNGGKLLVDFTGGSTTSDLIRITDSGNTPGSFGGLIDLTAASDTLDLIGTGSGTYTIATFGAYAPGTDVFGSVLLNGAPSQSVNPAAANYALVHYNTNSITADVATTTPEPAALGLLGAAATSLLLRRRRPR